MRTRNESHTSVGQVEYHVNNETNLLTTHVCPRTVLRITYEAQWFREPAERDTGYPGCCILESVEVTNVERDITLPNGDTITDTLGKLPRDIERELHGIAWSEAKYKPR